MIYVVDAIMGTGKTSAAINYMNNNTDRRYLYIAPYNYEAERIRDECLDLNFVCPSNHCKRSGYTKSGDLLRLVKERRNIAMTHELYCRATPEVVAEIDAAGYTIIIDEVVDVFKKPQEDQGDIDVLVKAKLIVPDPERSTDRYTYYKSGDTQYKGRMFKNTLGYVERSRLVGDNQAPVGAKYLCWMLHRELFTASRDIYVLTYLFEGSPMYAFLKINNLNYKKIGARKTDNGYEFCEKTVMPEMVSHIRDYIDIVDKGRLNEIGDKEFALSMNWYRRHRVVDEDVEPTEDADEAVFDDAVVLADDGEKPFTLDKLKRNMMNYYKHVAKYQHKFMWCTYKSYKKDVSDRGFIRSYTPWNLRAVNKYCTKKSLAFLVNVYMDTAIKLFFSANNADIDYDKYALSGLIQWVWRSAIRKGEKIQLYLPSSRMRRLLNAWMDDLESGGDGSGFTNKDVELAS